MRGLRTRAGPALRSSSTWLSSRLSRRSSASSLLLSSLELSDASIYEPCIRALLGTAPHFCEAVVFQLRTAPLPPTLTIRPNRPILDLRFTLTAFPYWGGSHCRSEIYDWLIWSYLEGRLSLPPSPATVPRTGVPANASFCPNERAGAVAGSTSALLSYLLSRRSTGGARSLETDLP